MLGSTHPPPPRSAPLPPPRSPPPPPRPAPRFPIAILLNCAVSWLTNWLPNAARVVFKSGTVGVVVVLGTVVGLAVSGTTGGAVGGGKTREAIPSVSSARICWIKSDLQVGLLSWRQHVANSRGHL